MTAAGTTAAGTTAAGTTAAADSAADTTVFKLLLSVSSTFFRERDVYARRGFNSTILAFLVPAVVVLRALLFASSGFSLTGLGRGGGVGGGNTDSAARFCRIEGSTVCHHK